LLELTAITRERIEPPPDALPTPSLLRLADLLGDLQADAAAAHEALESGRPRGPVTGLPKLDKQMGGTLAHGLTILNAGPGIGKTAWALQIAATCGFPALFVSCEMASIELFRRVIARTTCTPLDFIRSGAYPPEVILEKARQAIAACPDLALLDATERFVGPDLLRAAALCVRGQASNLLVVVDSVHSWADSAPGDAEEYTALGAAVASLRSVARGLNCPVLAIAERNRASMRGGGVSSSAGTRKFEYGSEAVIELDREESETRNGAGEVPVTLKLSKNRNGGRGEKVNLLWHDNYQRFREAV
jgi:replicative DNA helicase